MSANAPMSLLRRARSVDPRSVRLPGRLAETFLDLAAHDRPTHRHCAAVGRYSRVIAVELGLSDDEMEVVAAAALLHDVGKLRFPAELLEGDRELDDLDWAVIHAHPVMGARIAAQAGARAPVTAAIACHHERCDGAGYPFGLASDAIPLAARVIAVADAFDVMTARDSYAPPKPPRRAIAELRAEAGRQFDGDVVEAFVRTLAANAAPAVLAA